MKAMILCLSPEECTKLLNGDLSILVRKKFPKDYVGWVYIYCCKDKLSLAEYLYKDGWVYDAVLNYDYAKSIGCAKEKLNGKVVARFWCDNVEEIKYLGDFEWFYTDLLKKSCLNIVEFRNYLFIDTKKLGGYAIHITKLEIFDKPKELWEFKTPMMAERYKYDLEKAYEDDYEIGTRLAEGIADPKYECANCVELTELSEGYYGLSQAPRNGRCYVAELEN